MIFCVLIYESLRYHKQGACIIWSHGNNLVLFFAVKEGMVMVSQETDSGNLMVDVTYDNYTEAMNPKPQIALFDTTTCDKTKLTKEKASFWK